MEISPISGTRLLPTIKPPKNGPQLSAVFEIENAFGPQHDNFSHGRGRMAGGQDDEVIEQDSAANSTEDSSADESNSTVSLIA